MSSGLEWSVSFGFIELAAVLANSRVMEYHDKRHALMVVGTATFISLLG